MFLQFASSTVVVVALLLVAGGCGHQSGTVAELAAGEAEADQDQQPDEAQGDPFVVPETLPAPGTTRLQIDPKVYRWSAADTPRKMIHKQEGICFLTGIEGKFDAGTDGVRVYLADDGFWYLSGTAEQSDPGLSATAMALRFVSSDAADKPPSAGGQTALGDVNPLLESNGTMKRLEVKLPAPVDRVIVGGGGKYLLCHLKALGKLAILDVETSRIATYLPVGDADQFAAGQNNVVIVRSSQQLIQRYALGGKFQRELSIASPVQGTIATMVMGAASEGPVFLRLSGRNQFGQDEAALLDLQTLQPLDLKFVNNNHDFDSARVWAAADGQTFGFERSGISPSGLTTLKLQGKQATFRYEHKSVGHVIPSTDGAVLFTADGMYDANLQLMEDTRRSDSLYLPTAHPAFYLGITQAAERDFNGGNQDRTSVISIYSMADRRKLLSLPSLSEMQDVQPDPYSPELNILERLYALPAQKRLVTIPKLRDRIIIRRLDVVDALQRADIDYLYVASLPIKHAQRSARYTYPICVESRRGNVQFSLDSGPEGMEVSPMGVITWTVPQDYAERETGVIVTVRDASGQQVFHAYRIRIAEP